MLQKMNFFSSGIKPAQNYKFKVKKYILRMELLKKDRHIKKYAILK